MIIIVAGLPGSGKSYFAENLATILDSLYISSDRVRVDMGALGRYSAQDKLAVYREMLMKTACAIKKGDDVVLDATFYHHTMREMFVRLAEEHKVKVHVIEVVADEKLIRQRLQQSRKYSEADYSVYEQVRDDFEEITMPHLTLQSTNHNLMSMMEKAIDYFEN